jgi:hypothetical protein
MAAVTMSHTEPQRGVNRIARRFVLAALFQQPRGRRSDRAEISLLALIRNVTDILRFDPELIKQSPHELLQFTPVF